MRKTNLFYLKDNTSNFLTFSNYGEYLTGVCLSTNHKIYPSSFICLNLPIYDQENLNNFKQFLMCYYENKLAKLRDEYDKSNELHENIPELKYLLQAIYLYFKNRVEITYFGDIVEHDYNGMYSDSICIVDFKRYRTLNVQHNLENLNYVIIENENLYNWDTINEISDEDTNLYYPIYDYIDDNNIPHYTSESNIEIEINSIDSSNKIEFNCVIPLFDINDLNYNENDLQINENNLSIGNDIYKDIPYGIWFSNDCIPINLLKNSDNISQSWSLVISSKFAPYPYGIKINDQDIQKNIEQYTYAELLAKQSEILELFNQMFLKFTDLSDKVNNIEKTMHEINALDIDSVKLEMSKTKRDIDNNLMIFKNEIYERLNDLRWRAINTYTINND